MRHIILFFLLLGCISDVSAQTSFADRLRFSGDFRGRLELDRSSRKSDGTYRADRDRFRVRGRFALTYTHSKNVELGWRMRTGDPANPQSPHVTLGDNLSTFPVSLERLYARVSSERFSFWFGKNSNPFWHQNELFWDDDVTLEGIAGTATIHRENGLSLEGRAGYFILDTPNSNTFADQSHISAGQIVLSGSSGDLAYTFATSFSAVRDNPETEDIRLSDLDYSIVSGSVSITYSALPIPLRFGVDFAENTETYDIQMTNQDQRSAFVLSAQAGDLSGPGSLLLRMTYAKIEKYAIVGPFAQDDWLRWGSATMTQSSNFSGLEFRAAYAFDGKQNLVARLYTVDGITHDTPTARALQTGTRFRLDWNISF
jgi:Putative porin